MKFTRTRYSGLSCNSKCFDIMSLEKLFIDSEPFQQTCRDDATADAAYENSHSISNFVPTTRRLHHKSASTIDSKASVEAQVDLGRFHQVLFTFTTPEHGSSYSIAGCTTPGCTDYLF